MRKVLSRGQAFQKDSLLQALLNDIFMAKRISAIVNVANQRNIVPDEVAADQQCFSGFWRHATKKLVNIYQQHQSPDYAGFPNLFITVAPAEGRFPAHPAMIDTTHLDDSVFCFTKKMKETEARKKKEEKKKKKRAQRGTPRDGPKI